MMTCEDAAISKMVLHKVGNKTNNEPLGLSKAPFMLHPDISGLLLKYFLTPFKSNMYYNFAHESNLDLNKIFFYCREIFNNPSDSLFEQSCNIAAHLYDTSIHPNIKSGELYVTYLENCYLDGEILDAIGIFKSESKETYLKVYPQGEGFEIESDSGININKLDKGCIIFNKDSDKGYVVSVVDTISRGNEAVFWIDDFLHLKQRKDSYFNTEHAIEMCRGFVNEYLPTEFEMSKADQAELLSKSAEYFKEHNNFNIDDFRNTAFEQPELQNAFNNYKSNYEEEMDMEFENNFKVDDEAFRKGQRCFKSILKLDKNFTVYIHGKRERMESGTDKERNLKYYKFFYEEEK
ncbi:MAG: nucleoid-associated protein [Bacteroidales bacterium]|jgi:hypothetical protein|nr:nucleoid-associated protein [Bacteroidales bacterium]